MSERIERETVTRIQGRELCGEGPLIEATVNLCEESQGVNIKLPPLPPPLFLVMPAVV